MSTETVVSRAPSSVAHRYLMMSAAFAVFAGLALTFNALQLVWPDLGGGVAFLTFGRVRPMALNAIVFGWLALGLVGAAFHIVPAVTSAPVWKPRLAIGALALSAVSIVGGIASVGTGVTDGEFLFEMPLLADVGLVLGLALAAVSLIRSAMAGGSATQPALWFTVGGAVWLPLAFVAGAAPGLKGINAAIQNSFGITSIIALGLLSLALGAAYFVAGELRGSHEGTRVGRLAFWTLGFVAAWTAPRLLALGPAPDWLETVGVTFSFVLLVPVAALLWDLAGMLRGTAGRRLIIAGGGFLMAFAVLNLTSSLRSPSSITRFTSWDEALLLIPLLGVAGCWLLAFASHAAGRHDWRLEGRALVAGTTVAAFAGLAGGLQQGIAWVGGVNAGDPVSSGEFFAAGSTAWYVMSAVGIAVASLGLFVFAFGVFARSERSPELALEFVSSDEAPEPADPIAISMLVRGAVALFALAAASVFLIPTLEAQNRTATLAADAVEVAGGSPAAVGQDLYVSEGCVYCHTQQVRPIIADVGLGAVSLAGDYVGQSPELLGVRRIGPDLTHIGTRTESIRLFVERLRSPRGAFDGGTDGGWAIMPSYDYLSDDDLLALAEYLGGLN